MHRINLAPTRFLSHPLAVGFEAMLRDMESLDKAGDAGFPPYDIASRGDGGFLVSIALAGYSPDQLDVTVEGRFLTVSARVDQDARPAEGVVLLRRGIARRAFARRFLLAEHIVPGEASFENGLLTIELTRQVPEAARLRHIAIGAGQQRIEAEASLPGQDEAAA